MIKVIVRTILHKIVNLMKTQKIVRVKKSKSIFLFNSNSKKHKLKTKIPKIILKVLMKNLKSQIKIKWINK